jgi:hypothetical protein
MNSGCALNQQMNCMEMIEFEGTYRNESGDESHVVLVQYDGVLLHIWHISDPFYRLLSSEVFHLGYERLNRMHRIKLPNGGRILTDDDAAISLLRKRHRDRSPGMLKNSLLLRGIAALLLSFVVFAGAWMVLN